MGVLRAHRRAIIEVSVDNLSARLFGNSADIIHARIGFDAFGTASLEFVIEGAGLAEVPEGHPLPYVKAIATEHADRSRSLRFEPVGGA